jgi:chromosome segregation ATPase
METLPQQDLSMKWSFWGGKNKKGVPVDSSDSESEPSESNDGKPQPSKPSGDLESRVEKLETLLEDMRFKYEGARADIASFREFMNHDNDEKLELEERLNVKIRRLQAQVNQMRGSGQSVRERARYYEKPVQEKGYDSDRFRQELEKLRRITQPTRPASDSDSSSD